jgi:hypothetical protein
MILQPWTTFSFTGTFIQGAEGWLDLGEFGDVAYWVDVANIVNGLFPLNLSFQTSPSWDNAYFQPVGPPLGLLSTSPATQVYKGTRAASTVPLARWVRYRLDSTAGSPSSATLRIRVAPARQSFFAPTQLPGCVLWLRSDMGITGGFSPGPPWNDQSNTADPNEDLITSTAPTYNASDANYNGLPSFSTGSGAALVSAGAWATPLLQPSTWVVVADNYNMYGTNQYLTDADDATTGQSIQYNPGTSALKIFANGSGVSGTTAWSGASAVLGEWNGASSRLYFNNFTTPLASGTVGGGSAGSQGSMTLFAKNVSTGGGSSWNGSVAEIIAYSGILSPTAKAQLRLYLNSRYQLSIT